MVPFAAQFFGIFMALGTGFSKKDTRLTILKNIPNVLRDVRKGKIIEISTLNY